MAKSKTKGNKSPVVNMSKQPSSRPECVKETDNSDDANYDENPLNGQTAMKNAKIYSTIDHKLQAKIMEQCNESPPYFQNHHATKVQLQRTTLGQQMTQNYC